MANIKCIDVSEWQGNIDWKKVKSAGYGCAILRAGFGRSATQVDKQFEKNYKNATSAGVKIGVYWYSYAVDKADAVKEAKACLQVIKGKKLDMPVFFDMEESTMTKLGKSTLTAMAKAFCEEIKKGGYRAGVYSNPNWFTNYLNYKELRSLYPVWLAQYYKEPQFDCDIWQYSSEGTVDGVSGNVDMNIIYSESIIAATEDSSVSGFETAGVQALLRQAYAQGIVKTFIKPIDNKLTDNTKKAILEAKTALKIKNPDTSINLEFIVELEHLVNVKREENFEKARGDVNKDGKVDIKDATAIQKKIAGIED